MDASVVYKIPYLYSLILDLVVLSTTNFILVKVIILFHTSIVLDGWIEQCYPKNFFNISE